VGDTAVTFEGTPLERYSTFGELQSDSLVAIDERIPKVLVLARDVMVGVSGSVRRARIFAELLRKDVARGRCVDDSIHDLGPAFRVVEDAFAMVIAFVKHGQSQLRLFSTAAGIETVDGMCVLGSARPDLVDGACDRIRNLIRDDDERLSPDVVLVSALAQLQAYSVASWLPEQRIGGAFLGAYLSPTRGVVWQDTGRVPVAPL
jgi:hypothetical protein